MASKTRLIVLILSAPIIAFAVVGGFLSRAMAGEDSYRHLRVFEDVVSLILNNYVEPVESDRIMRGAMHGLADGLDADSAYLTPEDVTARAGAPAEGELGLELTRQYYLRVIAALDGSPAANAGLATGDYIRAIDGKPTRDMSVYAGMRALRGAPGSSVRLTVIRGNAADPQTVTIVREAVSLPAPVTREVQPGIGLVRIAAFTEDTADALEQQVTRLAKSGAAHVIVDLRGTAVGAPELGIAPARLFVESGVLGAREGRRVTRRTFEAESGGGKLTVPLTLLVDNGTSSAAEVFAAALAGNDRADLVGEHTLGRAAEQELVRLPDGSALWLSYAEWAGPDGTAIHGTGLTPGVEVSRPTVDFGAPAPEKDPILDKAIEHITAGTKAAA